MYILKTLASIQVGKVNFWLSLLFIVTMYKKFSQSRFLDRINKKKWERERKSRALWIFRTESVMEAFSINNYRTFFCTSFSCHHCYLIMPVIHIRFTWIDYISYFINVCMSVCVCAQYIHLVWFNVKNSPVFWSMFAFPSPLI